MNDLKRTRSPSGGANNALNLDMIRDQDYGELLPYVRDTNVTDINWNGKQLWIDDLQKGRYLADVYLNDDFVNQFSIRLSNVVSKNFNKNTPVLEAETDTLRLSIIHESAANTGKAISIRKTPALRRMSVESILESGYCSPEVLSLLTNAILAKMNVVIAGLPGCGKTELLKFFTKFIPASERVITIEDSLEIHYSTINPDKDCVELKVSSSFSYSDAIKTCLRQLPTWILLSEARSAEVKYLIESISTGTHCITTLHTDDVRKIPERIKNMASDSSIEDRIENDVYSFINVGISLRKVFKEGGIKRYIHQVCFFLKGPHGENLRYLAVDEGKLRKGPLPPEIQKMFSDAGIVNPFTSIRSDEPVQHTQRVQSAQQAQQVKRNAPSGFRPLKKEVF